MKQYKSFDEFWKAEGKRAYDGNTLTCKQIAELAYNAALESSAGRVRAPNDDPSMFLVSRDGKLIARAISLEAARYEQLPGDEIYEAIYRETVGPAAPTTRIAGRSKGDLEILQELCASKTCASCKINKFCEAFDCCLADYDWSSAKKAIAAYRQKGS